MITKMKMKYRSMSKRWFYPFFKKIESCQLDTSRKRLVQCHIHIDGICGFGCLEFK